LDELAGSSNIEFSEDLHAFIARYKFKSRVFVLIKPTTYVNLSGKAVNYWLQKEKIASQNFLVILDDISLPFGTLRLKPSGGDAGHNGLKSIQESLGHNNYCRLRFGIGNNFLPGQQVDYVLGKWNDEENKTLPERLEKCTEIIKAFGTIGVQRTMNEYNSSLNY